LVGNFVKIDVDSTRDCHRWSRLACSLSYAVSYVLYMLFITTGVMNVLTGVFLGNADEFIDIDLIVQNERVRIEQFCTQMLDMFKELDPDGTGYVTWKMFNTAMRREDVRAYLSSMCMEPTHVHLVFDLLDEDRTGSIKLDQFVMGMVRLKGEAKSVDVRIIQIGLLPGIIRDHFALAEARRQSGISSIL